MRDEFGVDDAVRILYGISFGYEDVGVPANQTRTTWEPLDPSVTFKA